jgi:hypothetical protein
VQLPRTNTLEFRRSRSAPSRPSSYTKNIITNRNSNSRLALKSTTNTSRSPSTSSDDGSDNASAEHPKSLPEKKQALQDIIDASQEIIEAKHKHSLKLRKNRAKYGNIVEDCEDIIQVEDRTIYKGQGDIELALEYLEYLQGKRIKYLRAWGDKQKQLEKCYKAIGEAQDKSLEAKAEMEDL